MTGAIDGEVAALAALDLDALRGVWRARYGAPPPLRSAALLRLQLAWRIQAGALGGFSPETRRQLTRRGRLEAEGLAFGVGAMICREWQGKRIAVVVEEGGFRCEGRLYKSLSAAASAIAGTRWNGPRFFGLRNAR